MAKNLSREYICEAFYKLLTKKHYNDITVGEICIKAGVSRMSFYRMFSSKEDLVRKCIDEICKQIKDNIEKLENPNVFLVTKTLFETIQIYSNIVDSLKDASFIKNMKDDVTAKLQTCVPSDYIMKTSKYYSIFYFTAITSVILAWLNNGAVESPEEMAKLLVPLVSNISPRSNDEINLPDDMVD